MTGGKTVMTVEPTAAPAIAGKISTIGAENVNDKLRGRRGLRY